MNDDSENLANLLSDDPDREKMREWSDKMAERYPYFPVAHHFNSQAASDPQQAREAAARLALEAMEHGLSDPADHIESSDDIYPPGLHPKAPTTDAAIATFLDNYGHQSPEEDALLERLIMNPVPDYAQLLDQEERASVPTDDDAGADDPHDRLIASFIRKSRDAEARETPAPPAEPLGQVEAPQQPPQQGLLSESLAKIYIKQRRYDRAYEIISQLSLNFPKKSAYFADQLRFLRKLIINQQYQQQK